MTVEELATEIEKLSLSAREHLYQRLGVIDQAQVRGAEIRIEVVEKSCIYMRLGHN